MWKARLSLVLLTLPHVTCNQAILTAPSGSTITLFAHPLIIPANGGLSVISALLIEPAGTVVPDGTVVQFFTTLGTIDEQGKTNDGVARVNLRATGRSGEASISAFSGPAAASSTGGGGSAATPLKVTIGNFAASSVIVTADPSIIGPGRSSSQIRATVFDSAGNPLAGVAVFFDITDESGSAPPPPVTTVPPSTTTSTTTTTTTTLPPELSPPGVVNSLDSRGNPQFTDNNGQAFDVLRTRNTVSGDVTVRARVPKGGAETAAFLEGDVVVEIVRN